MLRIRDENFENQPPKQQQTPGDGDRARFGFKRRGPLSEPVKTAAILEPSPRSPAPLNSTDAVAASAIAAAEQAAPDAAAVSFTVPQLSLSDLLSDALGDPHDLLPLLNTKLLTDRLDYKNRIAEVSDLNGKLKEALKEEGRRRNNICSAIVSTQTQLDSILHSLGEEAALQRACANHCQSESGEWQRQAEIRAQRVASLEEAAKVKDHKNRVLELKEKELTKKLSSEVCRSEEAEKLAAQLKRDVAIAKHDVEKVCADHKEYTKEREKAASQIRSMLEAQLEENAQIAEKERVLLQAQLHEKDKALTEQRLAFAKELQAKDDAASDERKVHANERDKAVAHARAMFEDQLYEREQAAEQDRALLHEKLQEKDKTATEERLAFAKELQTKEEAISDERKALQLQIKEVQQEKEKAAAEERLAFSKELHAKDEAMSDERNALQLKIKEVLQEKEKAVSEQRTAFTLELQNREDAAHNERKALQAQIKEAQTEASDMRASFYVQLQEKDESASQGRAAMEVYFQAQLSERDDNLSRAVAAFDTEREQLKVTLLNHQESISALRAELVDEKKLRSEELEASNKLSSEVVMHESRLKAVVHAQAETQREKAVLAASNETLQLQLSSVRAELEEMQRARASVSAENASLHSKSGTLQKELEEVRRLKALLSEKHDCLQTKVAELHVELNRVQAAKDSAEVSADATQLELTTLRKEHVELQRAKATQAAEAASLKAQLNAAHEEVNEALNLAGQESGCKASLAESVQDLREQLAAVRSNAQAAHSELMLERRKWLEEATQLRASVAEKTEALQTASQERRMLEIEFQGYKEYHGSSSHQQMEAISELTRKVEKLSNQYDQTQVELSAQHNATVQKQSHITSLERQIADAEVNRRELHNYIQELKGNIRVMCRVRPGGDEKELAVRFPEANRVNVQHGEETHAWSFDRVFETTSRQEDVFDEVEGLVQSALDGYKVCLFAYGQTGSGKTFTMQGTPEPRLWGLIPRSLSKIFETSRTMCERGWTWTLEASFLEVYNEALCDLLQEGGADGRPALAIQHNDYWGALVTNAIRVPVDSMAQINSLMSKAARQRSVGATDMNATSSRSHSVFALYLHGKNAVKNEELYGALHLVDLAGSERLDKSGAEGDRLRETRNINRSLSCLTDVFAAKSENRSHVPFRNSKLTHLMEPCLSGQGKTLMIVNVAPEVSNSHESLCALRFASRVSQCNTGGKPKQAKLTPGATTSSGAEARKAASPGAPVPGRQQQPSSASAPKRR